MFVASSIYIKATYNFGVAICSYQYCPSFDNLFNRKINLVVNEGATKSRYLFNVLLDLFFSFAFHFGSRFFDHYFSHPTRVLKLERFQHVFGGFMGFLFSLDSKI